MKYTYGFIADGTSADFGPIGVGGNGSSVYNIAYGGIAAVVSDTGDGAVTSAPKEELARHLAQHQFVSETVMNAGHSVLPVRFGTVLDSEVQVAEMLRTNSDNLRAFLAEVDGLIEIDVLAMWPDVQQVFHEIGREEDIVEHKNRIAKLPPGRSMAERVGLGKLVKDRLDDRKRALEDRILPQWEQVARRTLRHQVRHEAMIINAAFLVDAEGRDRLEARVAEADRQEQGALNFHVVGPLPPYSFNTVQLHRARVADLDAARREIDLAERITPQMVADAARSAMRRFHPDTDPTDRDLPQKFERVKTAADLLKRFCPPQGLDLRDTDRPEVLLVEPVEVP